MLITTTDFTGIESISTNDYTVSELIESIDVDTEEILKDLLGVELFDLFKADLVNDVPQDARFLAIYNSMFYDYYGVEVRSRGMKSMLVSLCNLNFVRYQNIKNTLSGSQSNVSSNSTESLGSRTKISAEYNKGVHDYEVIRYFIQNDPTTYPEFKGIEKKTISII